MYKKQRHFGVSASLAVFSVLISVVRGQSNEPQPYKYSINRSDAIRFPDDPPTVPAARYLHDDGGASSNVDYQRPRQHTSDIPQRSREVSSLHLCSCVWSKNMQTEVSAQ